MANPPDEYAERIRSLDINQLARVHAKTVDHLAVIERELAARGVQGDRVEPPLAAAEFY